MITIPEVVERLIKQTPFMEEGLQKGLLNLSAVARFYKKDIQNELMKPIQEGAIVMALNRMAPRLKRKQYAQNIFSKTPEMIVRSNLFEITVAHTSTLKLLEKMNTLFAPGEQFFMTITEGVFETTIIASTELKERVYKVLKGISIISEIDNLSSITIKLPKENITTPGIYYELLKALAWENINIIEVVSTTNENSIILDDEDVDHAFKTLKQLFKSKQ